MIACVKLVDKNKKMRTQTLIRGACGCPFTPRIGEIITAEGIYYKVTNVIWDLMLEMVIVVAHYQEPEDS